MKFRLKQDFAGIKDLLQALQWLGFVLSTMMVVPIVVGIALDLDHQAVGMFAQRTFFVCKIIFFSPAVHRSPLPDYRRPGRHVLSTAGMFLSPAWQSSQALVS